MLEIVQQTKKKTWKISESWGYFQILTNDNYEQTNGIQLEFFYTSPMLGIVQQTKEFLSHTSKIIILSLNVDKKILRNLELFSNFKHKINLNKCQQN